MFTVYSKKGGKMARKIGICSICRDPIYSFQKIRHDGCVNETPKAEYSHDDYGNGHIFERVSLYERRCVQCGLIQCKRTEEYWVDKR